MRVDGEVSVKRIVGEHQHHSVTVGSQFSSFKADIESSAEIFMLPCCFVDIKMLSASKMRVRLRF
jgi:hypothetical protein